MLDVMRGVGAAVGGPLDMRDMWDRELQRQKKEAAKAIEKQRDRAIQKLREENRQQEEASVEEEEKYPDLPEEWHENLDEENTPTPADIRALATQLAERALDEDAKSVEVPAKPVFRVLAQVADLIEERTQDVMHAHNKVKGLKEQLNRDEGGPPVVVAEAEHSKGGAPRAEVVQVVDTQEYQVRADIPANSFDYGGNRAKKQIRPVYDEIGKALMNLIQKKCDDAPSGLPF